MKNKSPSEPAVNPAVALKPAPTLKLTVAQKPAPALKAAPVEERKPMALNIAKPAPVEEGTVEPAAANSVCSAEKDFN